MTADYREMTDSDCLHVLLQGFGLMLLAELREAPID
jgi:hypothetical protein